MVELGSKNDNSGLDLFPGGLRPTVGIIGPYTFKIRVANLLESRGFATRSLLENRQFHGYLWNLDLAIVSDKKFIPEIKSTSENKIPVLAIVDRDEIVNAFNIGADMCIKNPGTPISLIPHMARKIVSDRVIELEKSPADKRVQISEDSYVSLKYRRAKDNKGNEGPALSRHEFNLFELLFKSGAVPVSAMQIADAIHGNEDYERAFVDIFLLRQKIGKHAVTHIDDEGYLLSINYDDYLKNANSRL